MVFEMTIKLQGINNQYLHEHNTIIESDDENISFKHVELELNKIYPDSTNRVACKSNKLANGDILVLFKNNETLIYKITEFQYKKIRN